MYSHSGRCYWTNYAASLPLATTLLYASPICVSAANVVAERCVLDRFITAAYSILPNMSKQVYKTYSVPDPRLSLSNPTTDNRYHSGYVSPRITVIDPMLKFLNSPCHIFRTLWPDVINARTLHHVLQMSSIGT
ncbi:hypothetical protein CBL_06622 [Carabus blaptoides fortunei]